MHIFLPTVSQKQAVNKKDSVGTIALTRTEVVERPYQICNSPRYEVYHPFRKGYNNPMREQHCHHPFDIETSTFQFLDNYKTLYIKLSLHHSKSFHATPTRMQR